MGVPPNHLFQWDFPYNPSMLGSPICGKTMENPISAMEPGKAYRYPIKTPPIVRFPIICEPGSPGIGPDIVSMMRRSSFLRGTFEKCHGSNWWTFETLFRTQTGDFLPKTWRRQPLFLPQSPRSRRSDHTKILRKNGGTFEPICSFKWGSSPRINLAGSEFIARSVQSCMAEAQEPQALGFDGSSSRSGGAWGFC